jgi:hypothetical protein
MHISGVMATLAELLESALTFHRSRYRLNAVRPRNVKQPL